MRPSACEGDRGARVWWQVCTVSLSLRVCVYVCVCTCACAPVCRFPCMHARCLLLGWVCVLTCSHARPARGQPVPGAGWACRMGCKASRGGSQCLRAGVAASPGARTGLEGSCAAHTQSTCPAHTHIYAHEHTLTRAPTTACCGRDASKQKCRLGAYTCAGPRTKLLHFWKEAHISRMRSVRRTWRICH